MMDEAILAVANALSDANSIDDIRQAFLDKGWNEDDIFLAIKGGEILFQKRQEKPEPSPADRYRFKRSDQSK